MKHKVCLFIFALFLMLSPAGIEQIFACWCRGISSCEAANLASAVFVGKVLKVTADSKPPEDGRRTSWKEKITFQVKENFSGAKDKTVEIRTGTEFGPGDCNYFSFKKGETYVVYAYQDKETGELSVGECGGTKSIAKAQNDLAFLRNIPAGDRNGKISGSVFGIGFDPQLNRYDDTTLAGVPLLLTGNGINKTILTNAEGDYELSGLKAGNYSLQVYLPDIYELFGSDESDDSVREIDLNGRGCQRESFFPAIKNTLAGTVKDQNGQPLENIEVQLIPENKEDQNDTKNDYTKYTDKDGRFMFRNIFPRRYLLGINIEGDDEEETPVIFYPNALNRTDAVRIDFGLGKKLSGYDLIWNKKNKTF